MKTPHLLLCVGASGSGKTTFAKQFVQEHTNFTNLNRDDIRDNYFRQPYKYTKPKEKLVTSLQLAMAGAAVDAGNGVVISDTNLNPKTRATWVQFAESRGLEVVVKTFYEPAHVLVNRNLKRADSRNLDVVYRMAKQMREFMGMPVYEESIHKPNAIIVDLDGTLADNSHRDPFNYPAAIDDKINQYLDEVIDSHQKLGYHVIILTGRESDESGISQVSVDWLDKNAVVYDHIWCRAHKDTRSDAIVKEELFFEHIADKFNVRCVYDDRDQVVHMWRSIGVTCYQVNYGTF